MAPCPHCGYMFDGWFPLKAHLENHPMCSLFEKQKQRKIAIMRNVRENKDKPSQAYKAKSIVKHMKGGGTYRVALPKTMDAEPMLKIHPRELATDVHKLITIRFSCPRYKLKGTIALDELILVKKDFSVASIRKDFRASLIAAIAAKRKRNEDKKWHSLEPGSLITTWLNGVTIKVSDELDKKKKATAEEYELESGEKSTERICAIIKKYLFHGLMVPEKELPLAIEFNMVKNE